MSTKHPSAPYRLRDSLRPANLPLFPAFTTQLSTCTRWLGGASSGDGLSPSCLAASLLTQGREWSGQALTCYMLRRFGWPNEASDDHKNLCSWTLTTPIKGLYLSVTPYMGCDGSKTVSAADLDSYSAGCSSLHFGYRYSKAVQSKLNRATYPPCLVENDQAQHSRLRRWWRETGCQKYVFAACSADEKETCVWEWGPDRKHPDHIWGLYVRSPTIEKQLSAKRLRAPLPRTVAKKLVFHLGWCQPDPSEPDQLTLQSLGITDWPSYDRSVYCEQRDAAETTGFIAQCNAALFAAIQDLLTPTRVRDVYFNGQGLVDTNTLPEDTKYAAPWAGAGFRPQDWFTQPRLRRKTNAAK